MHKLEQFKQDVAFKLPVIDEEDLTAQMDLSRKLLEDSNTALERSRKIESRRSSENKAGDFQRKIDKIVEVSRKLKTGTLVESEMVYV